MVTRDPDRRFQPATSESPPEDTQPRDRPPWMAGEDLDRLSPPLREAVDRMIQPAYEHFVLEADDEMEWGLGMTLVHLMWLELLSQVDLASAHAKNGLDSALSDDYRELIDRHMKLVGAKLRIISLLLRIQRSREKNGLGSNPLGGLLGLMAAHRAAAERQSTPSPAQTAGTEEDAEEPDVDSGPAPRPRPAASVARQASPATRTHSTGEQDPSANVQTTKNADQHSTGQSRNPPTGPIEPGKTPRR